VEGPGEWLFGGNYSGGKDEKLEIARSVYTFCKRPEMARAREVANWTTFAMVGRCMLKPV